MSKINIPSGTVTSLSLFVGTGRCNANCAHCAGRIHRPFAPTRDGDFDRKLVEAVLRQCYQAGARYLSLSGSGEPTLSPKSVTAILRLITDLRDEGIVYTPINLYTNGIRLGTDQQFADQYLAIWKKLGLTTIYLTIHSLDKKQNASVYGVTHYPNLETIIRRILSQNLKLRINLVLSRTSINTAEKFSATISTLRQLGVDSISAWPLKNDNDEIDDQLAPSEEEMGKIERWVAKNSSPISPIRLPTTENQLANRTRTKLTLFPDGTLTDTWCNR